MDNMLSGLQLSLEFFNFFLQTRVTSANFKSDGNIDFEIHWLIFWQKYSAKQSEFCFTFQLEYQIVQMLLQCQKFLLFSKHKVWDQLGRQLFFDERYFRLCFYFSSKKWLYRLPKGFVICYITCINITKEVLLFTSNKVYTEITLLTICLSVNVTFCV